MFFKRIILFLILCIILSISVIGYALEESVEVKIADISFKNALRDMCGIEKGMPLYVSDVEQLSGIIDLSNKGISDASGIKYLVNATSINLSNNKIINITGDFSILENLITLDLSRNEIYTTSTEINLDTIPNLKNLDLSFNKMKMIPNSFMKLEKLETLNISANRLDELSVKFLNFNNIKQLNCDFNFFDLSEESDARKMMDELYARGCQLFSCKQLLKLPAVTYNTEGGYLVAKWQELYDIPFYDGTIAMVDGYAVLVDGEYVTSIVNNAEYVVLDEVTDSDLHVISVSPNYRVEGSGDFDIRFYTQRDNVRLGNTGPDLKENEQPILFENFYNDNQMDTIDTTVEPSAETGVILQPVTPEVQEDQQEKNVVIKEAGQVEQVSSFSVEDDPKSIYILPMVALGIIIVLIIIIVVLLITLIKNKNMVGKDESNGDSND